VALILNITPDHLDWHKGFDDYVRAKAKIFANQTSENYAIVNFRDPVLHKLVHSLTTPHLNPPPATAGGGEEGGEVAAIRSKVIFFNEKENENPNWDAVTKVGEVFGIAPQASMDYLRSFPGIEHRMERLASQDGITYINDSKSTNPSSLEWALRLMKSKVILLAGGRNKGSDFLPLAPLVGEKVKSAVLFGEAREEMAQAWKDGTQCHLVNDLNEAFGFAADSASWGDTILLSPGCASFDQFKNYEERGTKFKKLVRQLRYVRR
jgi:UDP-N-acetylmuramoylalanine--D-glutamate ligase